MGLQIGQGVMKEGSSLLHIAPAVTSQLRTGELDPKLVHSQGDKLALTVSWEYSLSGVWRPLFLPTWTITSDLGFPRSDSVQKCPES